MLSSLPDKESQHGPRRRTLRACTPRQLLGKIQADFERLQSSRPLSKEAQYAAVDFFVTTEHIPEWVAKATNSDLASLRRYPDGELVSHVANGAKHFRVDSERHNAVRQTQAHSGAFDSDAFDNAAFDVDSLIVEHEDGRTEAVLQIAARVLEHWRQKISEARAG